MHRNCGAAAAPALPARTAADCSSRLYVGMDAARQAAGCAHLLRRQLAGGGVATLAHSGAAQRHGAGCQRSGRAGAAAATWRLSSELTPRFRQYVPGSQSLHDPLQHRERPSGPRAGPIWPLTRLPSVTRAPALRPDFANYFQACQLLLVVAMQLAARRSSGGAVAAAGRRCATARAAVLRHHRRRCHPAAPAATAPRPWPPCHARLQRPAVRALAEEAEEADGEGEYEGRSFTAQLEQPPTSVVFVSKVSA